MLDEESDATGSVLTSIRRREVRNAHRDLQHPVPSLQVQRPSSIARTCYYAASYGGGGIYLATTMTAPSIRPTYGKFTREHVSIAGLHSNVCRRFYTPHYRFTSQYIIRRVSGLQGVSNLLIVLYTLSISDAVTPATSPAEVWVIALVPTIDSLLQLFERKRLPYSVFVLIIVNDQTFYITFRSVFRHIESHQRTM
ncbi:unnamed protein product [Dicrocoelium dendriticum]|nr:unnamed protein product [Dicrocoelium dendriticum]